MPDSFHIEVNSVIYEVLTKMKKNLSLQIGDKATYKLVIQVLLKEHYSIPHLKQEISLLKKEINKLNNEQTDFMKRLLIQNKNQAFIPMSIPTGNFGQMNLPSPPPPPPKIPLKTPKVNLKNIKSPEGLKKEFVNEMRQVFDGTIRKPSEIIQATKPDHMNSEINEYDVDELSEREVDLEKKSSVLHNPSFFERTEKDIQYIN